MQVPKEGLTQKLQRLSASQQSIESVSSFCIFYNKDARGVVQIWDQEFYKANPERRLALLFLANHILQVRIRSLHCSVTVWQVPRPLQPGSSSGVASSDAISTTLNTFVTLVTRAIGLINSSLPHPAGWHLSPTHCVPFFAELSL